MAGEGKRMKGTNCTLVVRLAAPAGATMVLEGGSKSGEKKVEILKLFTRIKKKGIIAPLMSGDRVISWLVVFQITEYSITIMMHYTHG